MPKHWQHELTDCLENRSLCLITCMAPCYQYSLNAEVLDHNCVACCLIYALGMPCGCWGVLGAYMRTLIRHQKGIEGSPLVDLFVHCLFPCQALVQEGQEVQPQQIARE